MYYEATVKAVESFEGRRIAASGCSAESLEVPGLLVGDLEQPGNGRLMSVILAKLDSLRRTNRASAKCSTFVLEGIGRI